MDVGEKKNSEASAIMQWKTKQNKKLDWLWKADLAAHEAEELVSKAWPAFSLFGKS